MVTAASYQTYASSARSQVLSSEVSPDRQASISYELLVASPEYILRDLCARLEIPFEQIMLTPYGSKTTEQFKQAETVMLADPKLFKNRSGIDASQADKWRKMTLDFPLRSSTIALAGSLGYDEFPAVLPPELVWLKPPERHSSSFPCLLLCVHSGVCPWHAGAL